MLHTHFKRLRNLIAATLALGFCASALAGEGRRPVFTKTSLGNPGRHIVTRNISDVGTILEINSHDTVVDLNGFTLESTSNDPVILLDGFDNVTIKNGTVLGGIRGISITNCKNVTLENLEVVGAGGAGIALENTTSFDVRNSTIRDTGTQGLLIDGSGLPGVQGSIEENLFENNFFSAIDLLNGTSVSIEDNRILNTNADGIRVQESFAVLVSDNTVRDAVVGGIRIIRSRGTRVEGNAVSIADEGILIEDTSEHNIITRNVVTDITGPGILVDGNGNHITSNTVGNATQCGIWLTALSIENVYRGNMAKANSGCFAACVVGTVSTADFCDDAPAGSNDSSGNNFMPFAL
ncbi:hypothetical protein ABI59_15965 [Acidobacteria bacterium Mor1]|nr:hypothetical protein ABI59_15965 [Acidobacteria bacterium Mor1]